MTPAMEGIQVGIEAHLQQPVVKPPPVLVAEDGLQVALVVASLEQGHIGCDIVVPYHAELSSSCSG